MSCSNVREILYKYINAYVDNELSSTDSFALERHLEVCDFCAGEMHEIEEIQNMLHSQYRYTCPDGLKESIKSEIAKFAESSENLTNRKKPGFSWHWLHYIIPPTITAAAAVLIVLTLLPGYQMEKNIEGEIVSAHVRSLMEDNLTHIESGDTHQVKPWFSGRVVFAPQAKDLDKDGFNLIGGRLDYINKYNSASLVYQIRKHPINLFIFPTTENDSFSLETSQNRGYNIVKWTSNGLEYYAISDLNMKELKQFAEVYRN